jgi:hypothetical protein
MIVKRGLDYEWIYTGTINMVEPGPSGDSSVRSVTSTTAGKRYAEILIDSFDLGSAAFGVVSDINADSVVPGFDEGIGLQCGFGSFLLRKDTVLIATGGPFEVVAGQVINIAVDMTAQKVWLGIDGTYYYNNAFTVTAGGNPAAGTLETETFISTVLYVAAGNNTAGLMKATLRTQTPQFTGSIPSGFSAWYP